MKNWMKKVVAGAVVLSSSIGLAGCSLFKDEPSQEGYIFKGYEDSYYVNDTFSIVGTKLRITDKNGKTTEVSVTEDMIKHMPDMTTAGQKTVVIEYNGVEYSFTITIENRTNEQLMTKLKNFLRRYESDKDSLIEAGVVTNLQAKYLDEVVDLNEEESLTILSQMFDHDKLLDATYNSLFDAIVQGSFDLDENLIVSSNELKAKLDTVKTLEHIKQSMSNFDMRTYLIDLILPRTDAYYIDMVSDYIGEICEVNSVTGKREINKVVTTYYNKLKNFEKFELADAYTELLEEIKVYSVNPVVKEMASTLKTNDPEQVLHIFSNIIETQWLNYGYVMYNDMFAKHEMGYLENPPVINTKLTRDLVKSKAEAERLIAYTFENAIKDLVNCESADDFKSVVLTCLEAYSNYASSIAEIVNTQKDNEFVLVMKDAAGYYDTSLSGSFTMWNDFENGILFEFEPRYDAEVDKYTNIKDNCDKYYNDIKELGFVGAAQKNAIVEELLENFEYPEEDKQVAIDNIYDILNGELEGEDLYWAIADVLFPNSANEYIEEVKNIVKSYLDNGLVSALEDNELVEQLIDLVSNYPEEHKQQAIDTIYSILKEGKTGKELYLDIIKILTPNADEYYIDYACEFINQYLSIESVSGQEEIRELITKYFNNIKTATEFDVKEAYTEILTAINIHSTNDIVKIATKDLESLEIEQMIHIVSDIVYTSKLEKVVVATQGANGGSVSRDFQIVESRAAQNLADRYAANWSNYIRAYEDAAWELLSTRSVEGLFDIVLNCVQATKNYYVEEIEIVKELEANKWALGEICESYYYNGTQYVTENYLGLYYYAEQKALEYNYDIHQWEYEWVGYTKQLVWLNDDVEIATEYYDYVDLAKSLVLDPIEAIDKLIAQNKQTIIEYAMEACYNYLGVEEDSCAAIDIEQVLTDAVDDYLDGTLDMQIVKDDLWEIVDNYGTDETKVVLNTLAILYTALNYDETIDYNEMFKDIPLPPQVEEIDYNKLMDRVMNKDTYDIFSFSDIEVEYITDENEKIIAEKLTLKVDVDFDVLISSLKGDVTFTLTLDFEPDVENDDTVEGEEFGDLWS